MEHMRGKSTESRLHGASKEHAAFASVGGASIFALVQPGCSPGTAHTVCGCP
jgi:hypothetical protein